MTCKKAPGVPINHVTRPSRPSEVLDPLNDCARLRRLIAEIERQVYFQLPIILSNKNQISFQLRVNYIVVIIMYIGVLACGILNW